LKGCHYVILSASLFVAVLQTGLRYAMGINMKSFMLKHKKAITVVLLVCVLTTMIPIIADLPGKVPSLATETNDKKIAADISSSTGVAAEKILALKKGGKSWNEILVYLKGKGGSTEDREEMDNLLTEDVLGEADVKQLLASGFSTEEIQQAKLLAERVQFQLQEITSSTGTEIITDAQNVPATGGNDAAINEDTAAYKELEEKFNLKTVIILMLKLKDSFGSMEEVMNEYLYSLQIDINLEDYLTDSEGYLEKKKDKSIEAEQKKIITMSDIENEMLKAIQQKDVNNADNEVPSSTVKTLENTERAIDDGPVSPLPEMKDVTPSNPGDDIRLEIQQINPLK
jgi:hypothetical protein